MITQIKIVFFRKKSFKKYIFHIVILFFYKSYLEEYYSINKGFKRMDELDKNILYILQENSDVSLSNLSRRIGISKTPCWNRIRRMEEKGIISKQATILNRYAIGLPIVVFLSISVGQHSPEWTAKFDKLVHSLPEIVEAHRLTGSGADYL